MINFVKKLLGREVPVPTPEVKEHPLVTQAKARAQLKKVAYGLVWRSDGSPAIEADWVANLPKTIRTEVEKQLNAKGYSLDNDFNVIKQV